MNQQLVQNICPHDIKLKSLSLLFFLSSHTTHLSKYDKLSSVLLILILFSVVTSMFSSMLCKILISILFCSLFNKSFDT